MPHTRLLATADRSRKFELGTQKLLVCHRAGAFFVIENRCSHAQEPLDCGRVSNGWVEAELG